MKVQIVNKSKNELPKYADEGSAGLDLRADIENSITLLSNDIKLIPTELHVKLPKGTFGMITPRSGLAAKYGISIVNSPGIIDSTYLGNIQIILINSGKVPFVIEKGDRIAQMILMKYETIEWELVEELEKTERGENGFGSTGIK